MTRLRRDVRVTVVVPVAAVVVGTVDGTTYDREPVTLAVGTHRVARDTELTFAAGATVPHAESLEASSNDLWSTPLSGAGGRDHPVYATYSLILALFFGTMGLPHVLVRFYTNPDGRAARRTTLIVLCLLGAFYLFPTVYGALARLYTPDLLLTGRTDAAVLLLPERLVGGVAGDLLGALVTAGAFAAFLSTSSGLTVSVAGRAVAGRAARVGARLPGRGHARGRRAVRAVAAGDLDRDRRRGRAGVRGGRVVVLPAARAGHLVARPHRAPGRPPGCSSAAVWRPLRSRRPSPAWTAAAGPARCSPSRPRGRCRSAFLVMVVVSLRTPSRVPRGVGRTMVRLHAPESVALEH